MPAVKEAVEPPELESPELESPPSTTGEPSVVEEGPVESAAASARSEVPPPPATSAPAPRELPPALPQALPSNVGPATSAPAATTVSVPERLLALQARIVESIPPRWVEVARRYPVLWLVVAPVFLGFMLILIVMAFEPERPADAALNKPAASSAAAVQATAEPARAAPAPTKDELDAAALTALESKPAASLSVDELLLLNQSRAQHKRSAVKALSLKLLASPALIEGASVQGELLRFAADPDTAAGALAAMAQARAPVGPDLLYEVWSNRALSSGTTELARSLLYSRDVRPQASPALAVTLELRGAEGCEAVQAALPKTQSDGDARALPSLIKLTSRRGCGEKKRDDCYACLRSHTKQIIAATRAAKARRAPSYPEP